MSKFKSLLMVCTGNLCRSPMAEYLLRAKLGQGTIVAVSSAGIIARDGRSIDDAAREVLLSQGIDGSNHRARRLNGSRLSKSDLVLVVQQDQVRFIHESYPYMRGRVKMLTQWLGGADIGDPYGRSQEYYEQAFELIDRATESWLPYLD